MSLILELARNATKLMGRCPSLSKLFQLLFVLFCITILFHRPPQSVRSKVEWDVSSWMQSYSYAPHRQAHHTKIPCDPYVEPGHLFTSDELFDSRYIIYNDDQQYPGFNNPTEDWIVPSISSKIHQKHFDQLDFLKNRTILMIGDSIDRNLVIHFGRRALAGTKGNHDIFVPPDWSKIPVVKQPAHQIGVAHSPELNFTIYNWFLMGLGVQDEVPFFHAREDLPQRFETRLRTLFLPILKKSLLPRPDIVVINTGFWDLEYLARSRMASYKIPGAQPRQTEAPTNPKTADRGDGYPMSLAELAYHRSRLRKMIRFVRSELDTIDRSMGEQGRPIEIMYRSMQLGNTKPTNAFAAERIMQLDQSNRLVMKEFGIPVIEWGKMTIGLSHQLEDQSIHYGLGSVQYIFGDMLLFYMKRFVLGTKDEWVGCDWIRYRQSFKFKHR